jgi:hypothetical protein
MLRYVSEISGLEKISDLTLSLTAFSKLAQHFFEDQKHKEKLNIKI